MYVHTIGFWDGTAIGASWRPLGASRAPLGPNFKKTTKKPTFLDPNLEAEFEPKIQNKWCQNGTCFEIGFFSSFLRFLVDFGTWKLLIFRPIVAANPKTWILWKLSSRLDGSTIFEVFKEQKSLNNHQKLHPEMKLGNDKEKNWINSKFWPTKPSKTTSKIH